MSKHKNIQKTISVDTVSNQIAYKVKSYVADAIINVVLFVATIGTIIMIAQAVL